MVDVIERELDYHYRSLRLVWGFLSGRFIHCNLQVTWRCNFRCQICDFWKTPHDPSEELSISQIRVIGRKLNRLGTLIISLAGGEPLIREDLPAIARVLRECGHFPILITNGWFVDEPLGKALFAEGLQEISVSIDYRDPLKHDTQRGHSGAWQRGIRALEILNRVRPDARRRVHMISVLMDDNLDEIEDMLKLSRDLGVTFMVNLYSWMRGTKPRRLPHERVSRRLLELKRQYPEFVTLTSYIERLDTAIAHSGIGDCQTGRLLLNIDNCGNVARCTEMLDQPVGNLLREEMLPIRDRLYRRQKQSHCAQCWTSCRGFAESMRTIPRLRQLREFYTSVKRH
jgi:MoaA/NifB/PqqE/SkfB family radical SAM enzyme